MENHILNLELLTVCIEMNRVLNRVINRPMLIGGWWLKFTFCQSDISILAQIARWAKLTDGWQIPSYFSITIF